MFRLLNFSTNIAVISDKEGALTYSQLFDETESFRSHIPKSGLIFCLCSNSLGSLVGYVSGICHHLPLVMLDGSRNKEYVLSYIYKYYPEYIWLPSSRIIDLPGRTIYEKYGYTLLRMSYDESSSFAAINDELSLCLTTSGSTGSPKLVRLTENNLKSNAESIAEYLEIDEKERPITTLPMYYSFGLSVINSHLIKGATILLTDETVFSKGFWKFFEQSAPTSIAGVPFTYEMLEKMGLFKMALTSLKTMIQAGGKLNVNVVERYVRFASETNRKFIVMYGQTEASPRMSYLPFESAQKKPSSIGIPIPGGEFLLYNVNDEIIQESNVEGELIYKGPNVCLGYAESRGDLSKGDENHGILKTGDVAYRDDDGFYYITGRMKRFVKIWGNRYNLDAIEQQVKPITSNCACIGDDEKIYVFVENEIFINDINKLMSKTMQLDKSCYSVRVIKNIPKAQSGKVQYSTLKNLVDPNTVN